ncbi:MAG: hypothetical protein AAFV53_07785 [Myxococcota bacterium]
MPSHSQYAVVFVGSNTTATRAEVWVEGGQLRFSRESRQAIGTPTSAIGEVHARGKMGRFVGTWGIMDPDGTLRAGLGLPIQDSSPKQRMRWRRRVLANRWLFIMVGVSCLSTMGLLYWSRGIDFLLIFPLIPAWSALAVAAPYAAVGYLRRCSFIVSFQVLLVCLVMALVGAQQVLGILAGTLVLAGISWIMLRGIPILCTVPEG